MAHRTYTEQEVAALMERAAELQMQTARQTGRKPGLTLAELETIAREAGLDPSFLQQAATELDAPSRSLFESSTGTSATHVFVERWVPGTLTPEVWEDLVAELRHRYDTDMGKMWGVPGYGTSKTEHVGRTAEWRHTSMSGIETRVMVRPRGDGLRIRLSQRVGWGSSIAEAATYGAGSAGIAAAIAGAIGESGLFALAAFLIGLLLFIPAILYLDRMWRRKKHRELEALGAHLAALAATPAAREPQAQPEVLPLDATLLDDEAAPQQAAPPSRTRTHS